MDSCKLRRYRSNISEENRMARDKVVDSEGPFQWISFTFSGTLRKTWL